MYQIMFLFFKRGEKETLQRSEDAAQNIVQKSIIGSISLGIVVYT